MSVHVLLNLLSEFGKRDNMRGLPFKMRKIIFFSRIKK